MFEGDVTWTDRGHRPWVRTLVPDEIPGIARDLDIIRGTDLQSQLRPVASSHRDPEEEVSYVIQFFEQARIFMSMLAADGGGLIYVIG